MKCQRIFHESHYHTIKIFTSNSSDGGRCQVDSDIHVHVIAVYDNKHLPDVHVHVNICSLNVL